MKNINRFNVILLSFLLLTGCAVTDIDRKVNFNQLRTFAWGESKVTVEHPLHKGDLIDGRIKAAIQEEFAKKGIALDKRNPDFLVGYETFTEKKEERSNQMNAMFPYSPWGFYPYSSFGWWGMRSAFPMYGYSTSTREYTEGTLIVDIVDASSKEVVWRGSVSGNVDNVKALQKQIEKGVKAILKKYPGKPSDTQPAILPQKEEIG